MIFHSAERYPTVFSFTWREQHPLLFLSTFYEGQVTSVEHIRRADLA